MRCGTLCVLALIASKASAASTWIRLSSPSIEVFTDGSEKTARNVLNRFETLRRVFDDSHIAAPPVPLRMFIFSSADEYGKYRVDPDADAFYERVDDRDLMVLHESEALGRVASHEYLHMVMRRASAKLPPWLGEGVADFYSTLSISGAKMHIGDIIPGYLRLLALQSWLSAEDLALGDSSDGPLFYTESWALVHMLNLAPEWKNGMPQFVKLLNEGGEQDEAFTTAFGRPMADALKELRRYVRSPKELTLPAPPKEEGETVRVTRIAPVEATLALGDLALVTRHPDLARSLFFKAAKDNPNSPAVAVGLAELAMSENRRDDARRELDRAIALGYHAAEVNFELGALRNDSELLEKVLIVDPNFSEAHFLLGVRATDSGNLAAAIDHLQRAVAIQPTRFTYWHALGYAQAKSGDRQGAAESARRAVILAVSEPEEKMAAALTLLASEAPATREKKPHEKKPDVITPSSWQNRKGDARAEATLVRVDCGSLPVRLVLATQTPPGTIELSVQNPDEVELLNAEGASTTLVCGEQSRPVAVEYVAATKEITRLEFKHVIMKR